MHKNTFWNFERDQKVFFLCITCVDFVKGGQQYLSSGCAAIFGEWSWDQ